MLLEGYPQGICFLRLTADPLSDKERSEKADK